MEGGGGGCLLWGGMGASLGLLSIQGGGRCCLKPVHHCRTAPLHVPTLPGWGVAHRIVDLMRHWCTQAVDQSGGPGGRLYYWPRK